jgi:hypothetical protein
MALKLAISKSDAKRSTLVDPGWYKARIGEIEMKKGSKDKTANVFHIPLTITTPGKFVDVPLMYWVSEKAPGMAIPMLRAVGVQIGDDFEGSEFNLEVLQGKDVEVAITNELFDGALKNSVKDFAPIGTNTKVA